METILSQDQHEMGLHEDSDGEITRTRKAARAVLRNKNGNIAVMYFTTTGSYKLPGGGVDEGETIVDALHREIREETGHLLNDINELGIVTENRYYCAMHQISHCYTGSVGEFVGTTLTPSEQRKGMTLRWAEDIDQATKWIQSGRKLLPGEPASGPAMMIARETAILQAAKNIYE